MQADHHGSVPERVPMHIVRLARDKTGPVRGQRRRTPSKHM